MNVATAPLLNEQVVAPVRRIGMEPIRLALHQQLTATVTDVIETKVLLDLGGGQRLLATTKVPLSPGDKITLQVQNLDPQQIAFRLLPEAQTQPEQMPQPAANWVPELLSTLGIVDDEVNRAIALELLQRGLTIEPETVSEIRAAWENLVSMATQQGTVGDRGTESSEPVVASALRPPASDLGRAGGLSPVARAPWSEVLSHVVQLVSYKLPVTPDTVALAMNWSEAMPQLGEHTTALLSSLVQALTVESEHSPHMAPLRPLLIQLLVRVAAWPLQSDTAVADVADQVGHVLGQLGTPVERQLLHEAIQTPPASGMPAGSPVPAESPMPSETVAATTQWAGNMPPALAEKVLELVEHSGVVVNRELLIGTGASRYDQILLYQVAESARHLAADPRLSQLQRDAWHRVSQRIDRVLQEFRGTQLFNLREPTAHTADQYYTFPLPIATPEGPQSGRVQVFWHDNGKSGPALPPRVDPQDVRLLFRLDMPSLGPVEVDLVILQQRVRAHVRSDNEDVRRLARQHADELRQGLRRLDFAVEQCRTSVLTTDSPDAGAGSPPTARPERPVFRIDTVV